MILSYIVMIKVCLNAKRLNLDSNYEPKTITI